MSAVEIVMPRLSDAMEEGTIVRWLKDVGDQVEVGDELVEVETDKATVIYEAEISGLLSEILVQAGEAQQLGGPIARIGGTVVAAPAPRAARPRPSHRRRADRWPRPSPAAARVSWASTSQRSPAPARAGASGSPTSRLRPIGRLPPGRQPAAAPPARRPGAGHRSRDLSGRWPRGRRAPAAHLDAARDRAAHGRDDRHRAALPALDRRRLR